MFKHLSKISKMDHHNKLLKRYYFLQMINENKLSKITKQAIWRKPEKHVTKIRKLKTDKFDHPPVLFTLTSNTRTFAVSMIIINKIPSPEKTVPFLPSDNKIIEL